MLQHVAIVLFLNVTVINAMDMITLSNMCSDICGLKRPRAQEEAVNFNGLPLELHGKIVKEALNLIDTSKDIDQKELEKYILKIPMDLGIKFVREYNACQKVCWYNIGDQKFLVYELFCSPVQRNICIQIGNPSALR